MGDLRPIPPAMLSKRVRDLPTATTGNGPIGPRSLRSQRRRSGFVTARSREVSSALGSCGSCLTRDMARSSARGSSAQGSSARGLGPTRPGRCRLRSS